MENQMMTLSARARGRRWSRENHHFGPFTWSDNSGDSWGVMLDSGGNHESGRNKGCHLRITGFRRALIIELPNMMDDYVVRHHADWDAVTVARMGRDWYEERFEREFGFSVSGDAMHLRFGPQTFDSTTTKSKVVWIPWKRWRHVRSSLYGLRGETVWSQHDKRDIAGMEMFEAQRQAEATCPVAIFEIKDADGQHIRARTQIREREYRLGVGFWRWISLFRRPRISRSLDISFEKEVGPEKGSWKGGLMGTGIEMLPGELHEQAFRRYCETEHHAKYGKYRITFARVISDDERDA